MKMLARLISSEIWDGQQGEPSFPGLSLWLVDSHLPTLSFLCVCGGVNLPFFKNKETSYFGLETPLNCIICNSVTSANAKMYFQIRGRQRQCGNRGRAGRVAATYQDVSTQKEWGTDSPPELPEGVVARRPCFDPVNSDFGLLEQRTVKQYISVIRSLPPEFWSFAATALGNEHRPPRLLCSEVF